MTSGTIGGSASLTFTDSVRIDGGNSRTLTVNNSGLTTFAGPLFTLVDSGTTARTTTLAGTGDIAILGDIADGTAVGSLTITNTGTTTFSGANSYTGTTTMNSTGTLVFSGSNSSAGVTTLTKGTIRLNSDANGGLASGALNLNGGILQASGEARSVNGATLIGGTATVSGDQNLTFNGTVTNNTGDRTLTNNLDAGKVVTLAGNVYLSETSTTGRTFAIAGTGDTMITGTIADANGASATAGGVTVKSTGITTFAGVNTYTGATTVNGGKLVVTSTSNLSNAATTVAAGALELNNAGQTIASLAMGGGAAGTSSMVDLKGNTLTLAGNTSFSATNNTLGATINNGTLNLSSAAYTFTVNDSTGANADLTINAVIAAPTGATITKDGAGTLAINSVLSLDGAFLAKLGATTFGNSGTNTISDSLRVGVTAVGTGTLNYNDPNATLNVGTGKATDFVDVGVNEVASISGGVLNLEGLGHFNANVSSFRIGCQLKTSTGGSAGGTVILATNNEISATTAFLVSDTTSSSGPGAASSLQFGAGISTVHTPIMTLGGDKGATVNVTIASGGSVIVDNGANRADLFIADNSISTATNSTATVDFTGGAFHGFLDELVVARKASGSTGSATAVMTLGDSANNMVDANSVTVGSLSNAATGAQPNSGTLNFGGGSFNVVNNVSIGLFSGTIGTVSGSLNLTGGTFTVGGNIVTSNSNSSTSTLTLNGDNAVLDMTDGTIAVDTFNAQRGTLKNVREIYDQTGSTVAALSKTTEGTLTLKGSNTYTGATYIRGGTLALGADGSISNTPSIELTAGARFDVSAKLGGFTLAAGQTLKVVGTGTSTISGAINLSNSGSALNMQDGLYTSLSIGELNGTAGAIAFDLGTPVSGGSYVGDLIIVSSNNGLNLNSISLAFTSPASFGSYRLFEYTGSASLANIALPTAPTGQSYRLTTDGSYVSLVVSASAPAVLTVTPQAVNKNVRAGATTTLGVYVSNTAANGSDALNYTVSGNVTGSGVRAAGDTAPVGDLVTNTGYTAAAGVNHLSATVADISGANSPQTVDFTVTGYALASPGTLSNITQNLGTLHASTVAHSGSVEFANNTTADLAAYTDDLMVSGTSDNGSLLAGSAASLVANSTSNKGNYGFTLDINTAGRVSGNLSLTYTSTPTVGGLSSETVGSQTVTVSADVFSGLATWIAGDGSWNEAAKWTDNLASTVHAAPGTFAGFANTDTATFGGTTSGTVSLGGVSPSLKAITFNGGSYTIGATGDTGHLILAAATTATIRVTGGTSHTISSRVESVSNLQVAVNAGKTLTFQGNLEAGSNSLTIGGATTDTGTTVLSGTNNTAGSVTVDYGTLQVGDGATLTSTTITLNNASVLQVLAGASLNASGTIVLHDTSELAVAGAISVTGSGNAVSLHNSSKLTGSGNIDSDVYLYDSATFASNLTLGAGRTVFALGGGTATGTTTTVPTLNVSGSFELGVDSTFNAVDVTVDSGATFTTMAGSQLNATNGMDVGGSTSFSSTSTVITPQVSVGQFGSITLTSDNQFQNGATGTSFTIDAGGSLDANGMNLTFNSLINNGGTFTTGNHTGSGFVYMTGTGNSIDWNGGTNTVGTLIVLQDKDVNISGGTNTVASTGTLEVLAGGTGLAMSNDGSLTLNSGATVGGSLKLNDSVAFAVSGTSVIRSAGTGASAGQVVLGGASQSFNVSGKLTLDSVAVVTSGANSTLNKDGLGTMVLSNATLGTGIAVSVNSGKLLFSGTNTASGAVSILKDAIGGGTGGSASLTADALNVAAGGVLAVGDNSNGTAGTLTVAADTTIAGTLASNLYASGIADLLTVEGTLDITDATLNLNLYGDLAGVYKLVDYGTSPTDLTGTFSKVAWTTNGHNQSGYDEALINYHYQENGHYYIALVPEPSTWVMLLTAGIMGVGGFWRQRRRGRGLAISGEDISARR